MSRDFCCRFFQESNFPKPLKKTFGPFQIFSKIHRDIHKSCTDGIFSIGTAGVADTGGKITFGVNYTGGKLPLVSMTLAVNLPPVSMTSVENNGNNIRLLTPYSELEEKILFI